MNSKVSKITEIIKISFSDNKHNLFRKYCSNNDLFFIDELNNQHIIEFSNSKGVGKVRTNDVKKRLQKINLNQNEINLVFNNRKYKIFKDFCSRKNIKKIDELNYTMLKNFFSIKGIGERKIKDLHLKLFQIVLIQTKIEKNKKKNLKSYLKMFLNTDDFNSFIYFYKDYKIKTSKEIKITDLKTKKNPLLVIKNIVSSYYNNANNIDIRPFVLSPEKEKLMGDLEISYLMDFFNIKNNISSNIYLNSVLNKNLNAIKEMGVNLNKLSLLFTKINELIDPVEKIENTTLSKRTRKMFILKYQEKKTLKEIGKKFNVSRERVRQLLSRELENDFKKKDFENKIIKYLQIFSKNPGFIKRKTLIDLIGKENKAYIYLLERNLKNFTYSEIFDVYLFSSGNIDKNLGKLLKKIPRYFKLKNYISDILKCFENINIDINVNKIKTLLKNYGYNYSENSGYVMKTTLYKREKVEILFSEYIKSPLTINKENFKYVNRLFKEKTDLSLDFPTERAMIAALRDVDKIILVDHKTFIHLNKLNYDKSIIFKIKKYLKEQESKREIVHIDEIYNKLETKINKSGINNKVLLYSLIKRYLGNYKYADTNSGDIYLTNKYKDCDRKELLIKLLKKNNGIMEKKEINKKFKHLNSTKINNLINSTDKLLNWGSNVILSSKLDNRYKKEIQQLIEGKMNNGYLMVAQLLEEMKKDKLYSNILNVNGIKNYQHLHYYLKHLFKELHGSGNLLYCDSSSITSIKDIIIKEFPKTVDRKEMYSFLKKLKIPQPNNRINKLLEQEIYFHISKNKLIYHEKLELSENLRKKIIKYITKEIDTKRFLALDSLKNHKNRLPKIEYKWTSQLISLYLKKSPYRTLNYQYKDYRTNKTVIVPQNSNMQDLTDLVKYILFEEFKGKAKKKKLYNYLVKNEIISPTKKGYFTGLPKEILISSKFQFDKENILLKK